MTPQYKGRKLGELSIKELDALKTAWADKYAEDIKKVPAKAAEREMVLQAYAAIHK